MGDGTKPDSGREWTALAGLGESFDEFDELAGPLIRGGPPPAVGVPAIARAPMIIDTDIGGDPDDTVAVVVVARRVPELKLVITSDEYGGERARFVRYLLDLVGRPDVRVVAGSDLGNSRMYWVDGMCPADVPRQRDDVISAVIEVCAAADGRVRWVGMGPLSNLAMLQEQRPELVARMVVTQMGGAINYRDRSRAEHNFRVDPDAAIRMVPALEPWLPTFVVSDVTFNPAMEITADSPLYKRWAEPDARPWERVLREHWDRWMAKYPGSMQHDGLALAAATLWPGVRFMRERVVLDDIARMSRSDDGTEIVVSVSADYAAFMSWLDSGLGERAVLNSRNSSGAENR
jgi:pyrimidine-specific ribonucleoside hydrolase